MSAAAEPRRSGRDRKAPAKFDDSDSDDDLRMQMRKERRNVVVPVPADGGSDGVATDDEEEDEDDSKDEEEDNQGAVDAPAAAAAAGETAAKKAQHPPRTRASLPSDATVPMRPRPRTIACFLAAGRNWSTACRESTSRNHFDKYFEDADLSALLINRTTTSTARRSRP